MQPNCLQRLQNGENLNLLDVREVIEYPYFNIGGQNIPLAKLEGNINSINYNKTDEIIVICKVGYHEAKRAGILTEKTVTKNV
jgi:rhodanese-related sulfurtransferase